MAITKSDIYTTQSAVTGDNRADGRLLSGKVRQAHATITFDGDEDASSALISLVELPQGAIVDPSQSYLLHEACGAGVTVDVGFDSDADGLTLNGVLDLSSAGKTFLDTVTVAPVTIASGDEVIKLDITAATGTTTASAKVRAVITFIDRN
jgi:hypothetical protein